MLKYVVQADQIIQSVYCQIKAETITQTPHDNRRCISFCDPVLRLLALLQLLYFCFQRRYIRYSESDMNKKT